MSGKSLILHCANATGFTNRAFIGKADKARLDTDQTINALGIKSINAEKMMLKKIRKFVF
jgi:hypothetical protein